MSRVGGGRALLKQIPLEGIFSVAIFGASIDRERNSLQGTNMHLLLTYLY